MKKLSILFLYLLLFLFISNISAQTGWVQQPCGTISNLSCVYATSQSVCYVAVPNDGLLKTTNGGNTWFFLEMPTGYNVGHIFFTSSNTGYVSAKTNIQFEILKTTNAGNNWSILNYSSDSIWNIFFISDNTGWVLSKTDPCLYKTTDGGNTWLPKTNNFGTLMLNGDLFFPNAETGYCTGEYSMGGVILSTSNGGNWWVQVNTYTDVYNSLFFINALTGWGTTNYTANHFLRKTTNGGYNWIPQYNIGTANLWDIYFINENTGWVVGDSGKILYTSNYGLSWNIQQTGKTTSLKSIFFIDNNTGWAVGSGGVILKSTTGGNLIGIKPISENIPDIFLLSQNYPNPFNPSTTIEFDIPVAGYTKLTVYDLQGRESEILVSEELSAGSYRINFDGNNLSSGIYFYKLETKDFIQTKRMVLIK
ncbi:MAG: T9SS C-terminal target domain-containing protein [Ignavibacteriae bacterium]|nr:MAG: T9SS C-terminal target domain-containing protein [Ignavibacteriota bacterium]